MNKFVQEAIEERLLRESSVIEVQLQAALDLVRQYHGEDLDQYARAFAHAEVTEYDLGRATALTQSD